MEIGTEMKIETVLEPGTKKDSHLGWNSTLFASWDAIQYEPLLNSSNWVNRIYIATEPNKQSIQG